MDNQDGRPVQELDEVTLRADEETLESREIETAGPPGWREVFRQAFEKARRTRQPVRSQRELGKDKSKSLLVLAGAAVMVILLFLGVFSGPNKPKRPDARHAGTPDLGRRVTPGQENVEAGKSATPLLDADVRASQTSGAGTVTAADIDRTARLHGPASGGAVSAASEESLAPKSRYALNRVDFSDPVLKQQAGYGAGAAYQQVPPVPQPSSSPEGDPLRKPSLVFVRSTNQGGVDSAASSQPGVLYQGSVGPDLPPGTRLVARLEAPASTAVKQPVIAVVEYNYEKDGEIVLPAGAKAVGQLRQADHNGFVDIKFESLEMPDGLTEKLDGVAMGLDFRPLKGNVSGKKTATRFLVETLTGVGSAAAFLVGGTSTASFSGLSEDALLRERIANNVGVAGDQQLNELAFNQNIVVTVPGNTRFYIVLENPDSSIRGPERRTESPAATGAGNNLPTADELRQLMQLRQELSQMYQQADSSVPAPEGSQP
ncbi:MAG TPA: hypothetical protein VMT20_05500 [Terriglobia bacterium]|nr:hypothetical protein [Terriglobia bacterium]